MTLSDKLTRDQVRDAITANLTYSQIQPNDIRRLKVSFASNTHTMSAWASIWKCALAIARLRSR